MGKRKASGRLQTALHQSQERQQQEAKRQKREQNAQEAQTPKASTSASNNAASELARPPWIPFSSSQKILLVGEGNFSFAASLAAHVCPGIGSKLVATAYDTEAVASEKYPDLQTHLSTLREAGAQIHFNIDAARLDRLKPFKTQKHTFDRIAFVYPHTGSGEKDERRNVRSNQALVLSFLRSAAPLLVQGKVPTSSGGSASSGRRRKRRAAEEEEGDSDRDGAEDDTDSVRGCVLLVLRQGKPYDLWDIGALAKQGPQVTQSLKLPGLQPAHQPAYIQIRSGFFEPSSYPGYAHRRTLGFDESVSTRQNEDTQYSAKDRKKAAGERGDKVKSRMWMFSLKDSPTNKDSSDSE